MDPINLAHKLQKLAKDNSPAILTALGVTGTISTAYLAAQAGHRHATYMSEENPHMSKRDEAKLVWKLYIPAGVSGLVAVGCIIGAARVGSKRTAALATAYSLTEKAFVEYREKIVETIGEKKEQAVRADLAQTHVTDNPPSSEKVIIAGGGNVLCCELFTGRYFTSDMETLRKAQNDINSKMLGHTYATMSDFYYMLGIPYTAHSGYIGWEADRLLELEFSTVMSEDNRPCLAFGYNYTKPF